MAKVEIPCNEGFINLKGSSQLFLMQLFILEMNFSACCTKKTPLFHPEGKGGKFKIHGALIGIIQLLH